MYEDRYYDYNKIFIPVLQSYYTIRYTLHHSQNTLLCYSLLSRYTKLNIIISVQINSNLYTTLNQKLQQNQKLPQLTLYNIQLEDLLQGLLDTLNLKCASRKLTGMSYDYRLSQDHFERCGQLFVSHLIFVLIWYQFESHDQRFSVSSYYSFALLRMSCCDILQ